MLQHTKQNSKYTHNISKVFFMYSEICKNKQLFCKLGVILKNTNQRKTHNSKLLYCMVGCKTWVNAKSNVAFSAHPSCVFSGRF